VVMTWVLVLITKVGQYSVHCMGSFVGGVAKHVGQI
jgi:hypothetical protein